MHKMGGLGFRRMGRTPTVARLRGGFIGDSLTEGVGNGSTTVRAGFRGPLKNRLGTLFGHAPIILGDNIVNRVPMTGASGKRTDEIRDSYLTVQSKLYDWDWAIMYVGMNDCTQRNSGTWAGTLEDSMNNLNDDINLVLNNNLRCKLFLCNLNPNGLAGANTQVDNFNTAFDTLIAAHALASRIKKVDINAAVKTDPSWLTNLMADNTHFNNAGYTVVENAIYAAMDEVY